jgi:hypothetical protein
MSLLLSPVQVIDPRLRCIWEGIRAMNTQGEIEAAICTGMARFEQEYMGRGPKDKAGLRFIRLAGGVEQASLCESGGAIDVCRRTDRASISLNVSAVFEQIGSSSPPHKMKPTGCQEARNQQRDRGGFGGGGGGLEC